MNLLELFSVNTIFFTVLDYPMSYIEFFGTLFTAWSVYLAAKNKIATWPTAIVGIILFGALFYQIQLYSDLLEQVYYFITGFWGWWLWSRPKNAKEATEDNELKVTKSPLRANIAVGIGILALSVVMSAFIGNIHVLFPTLFPVAASFPFLDAFTTVMSFAATIYLAKRKIENWYLWIVVDIIGTWLYFEKGVALLSILYFAFLLNAFRGFYIWRKALREND